MTGPLKTCCFIALCGFLVFTGFLPNESPLKPWLTPIAYSLLICVGIWMVLHVYDHEVGYDIAGFNDGEKECFLHRQDSARRKTTFLVGIGVLVVMYYEKNNPIGAIMAFLLGLILQAVIDF
jgi:hypothetical protein